MEIELLIRKKKEIYSSLMDFIDITDNNDIKSLIDTSEKYDLINDKEETILTL